MLPAIRLSMPGVDDLGSLLEEFQRAPDWQRYVVEPVRFIKGGGDNFPTIDHVIHTVLDQTAGFGRSEGGELLDFFLSEARGGALSGLTFEQKPT